MCGLHVVSIACHCSLPKLRTAVFQETAAEKLPNMRINIPQNGLLLTSAIKSEGGDGFSAIEFPHVKPAGASQHHHSMIEDTLFPPHAAFGLCVAAHVPAWGAADALSAA